MATSVLVVLATLYLVVEFFLLEASLLRERRAVSFGVGLAAHALCAVLVLWFAGTASSTAAVLSWVLVVYALASAPDLPARRTAAGFAWKHGTGAVMMAGVWLAAYHQWQAVHALAARVLSLDVLLAMLGFIALTRPASFFVSRIMGQWILQADSAAGSSLPSGGTAIGYLERALIVILILVEQWEAIGFLLAAKGILRFNELNQTDHRASSEYVILGTLLSFLFAISIGMAIKHGPGLIAAAVANPAGLGG